jgi:hypothetical protein
LERCEKKTFSTKQHRFETASPFNAVIDIACKTDNASGIDT